MLLLVSLVKGSHHKFWFSADKYILEGLVVWIGKVFNWRLIADGYSSRSLLVMPTSATTSSVLAKTVVYLVVRMVIQKNTTPGSS